MSNANQSGENQSMITNTTKSQIKNTDMTMGDIPDEAIYHKSPGKSKTESAITTGRNTKSGPVNGKANVMGPGQNLVDKKKDEEISKERDKFSYELYRKIIDETAKTNKEFNSCFPGGSLMKNGFLACFEDENT